MQQAACAGLGKSHYRFGQPPGPNVNPVPSPPLLLLISEETGKKKIQEEELTWPLKHVIRLLIQTSDDELQ